MIALLIQWRRSDQRTAKRLDRAADRDDDAELAAYNAMLAELARRDTCRANGAGIECRRSDGPSIHSAQFIHSRRRRGAAHAGYVGARPVNGGVTDGAMHEARRRRSENE